VCLAIFKPAGELPPLADIETAWRQNPHGAGMAVRGALEVEIYKGFMDLEGYLEFIRDHIEFFTSHDVVFHLRYSTSSSVVPGMTHPFPISSKNSDLTDLSISTPMAIIHNGVLFRPIINEYSDTAIFASWISRAAPTLIEIERVLGPDRLAIVTKDKVQLLGKWEERNGLMYSNLYSVAEYKSDWKWEQDFDKFLYSTDLDNCPHCGSENTECIGVKVEAMECLTCGTIYNSEMEMVKAHSSDDGPMELDFDRGNVVTDMFEDYSNVMELVKRNVK